MTNAEVEDARVRASLVWVMRYWPRSSARHFRVFIATELVDLRVPYSITKGHLEVLWEAGYFRSEDMYFFEATDRFRQTLAEYLLEQP